MVWCFLGEGVGDIESAHRGLVRHVFREGGGDIKSACGGWCSISSGREEKQIEHAELCGTSSQGEGQIPPLMPTHWTALRLQ